MKLKKKFSDPKFWRAFHLTFTVIWLFLFIPTLVFWPQSILWLALMSCWANFVGHFSAWQATRAEDDG